MTMLYLVRHAKPAATWGEAIDPGLDAQGQEQAEYRAVDLNARLPQIPIYTSPLKRCKETSHPLTALWQSSATILPEVAEIPSPPLSPAERQTWLAMGTQGTWAQLQASSPPGSPDYLVWRTTLLDALRNLKSDSVIYTHYIAINVAVGAAQGHDRVLSFRPGHASVTTLEVVGTRIVVRELGVENGVENSSTGVLLGQ
jgi:broad specificity phosphatase PhoE